MDEQNFGLDSADEGRTERLELDPGAVPFISPTPPAPELRPHTAIQRRSGALSGVSVTLGVLGILLSLALFGGLLGVAGIIVGLWHLVRHPEKKLRACLGVALSLVAILVALGQICLFTSVLGGFGFAPHMGELLGFGGFNRWAGVAAPDFEVTTLDGKKLTLADFRGQRMVVHVFDRWDDASQREAEHLERLVKEHPEVAVLGMDSEAQEKVRSYQGLVHSPYPVVCSREMDEPYRRFAMGNAFLFIDKKGVIDKVLMMVRDYGQFAQAATAGDFAGTAQPRPKGAIANAVDAPRLLALNKVWSRPAEGVKNIATGDWNGDGADELIVLGTVKVECIDAIGNTVGEWAPPLMTDSIRFGRCGREGRLLAKTMMGIYVYNTDGKALWHYDGGDAVDGCCFADVEGKGCDSVLMGLNGSGGLVLFTPEGKEAWKDTGLLKGNFWNQAALRTSKDELFLLTTSVSGAISRYSAKGRCTKDYHGCGAYLSNFAASEIDGQGHVQILGWGQDGYVAALDGDGQLVWRCLARSSLEGKRDDQMVAGDLDGDGVKEWTVPGVKEILIVSASGQILCHTGIKSAAPAMLNRPGKPTLFVVGTDTEITAYEATIPTAAQPQT